ncbi:MAG: YihY/virulence factor BrkB family protein [Pseudomonadota bacterium]|jgi:membrane protein|nr:YihY/virulence factor BrkB family protein [Pseudomonadota bacterium]
MNWRELFGLIKATAIGWSQDRASSMGAAIAFYTVLSLAPLLLIVISVAGLFFGEEAARGALIDQLTELVGENGGAAIQAALSSAHDPGRGLISVLIGVATLVIGATTVFMELQANLDRIWKAPMIGGVTGYVRRRMLSFGVILGVGFLLTVSLVMTAVITAIGTFWQDRIGGWQAPIQLLNFAVSFGIVTLLFGMIYKLLPSVNNAWGDVWTGAAVTSLLFSIGKYLIGLYIGSAAVSSSYGAAGAFVVLIVWVYYSAQIFLFGAEFTYQYACLRGSLRHDPIHVGNASR